MAAEGWNGRFANEIPDIKPRWKACIIGAESPDAHNFAHIERVASEPHDGDAETFCGVGGEGCREGGG